MKKYEYPEIEILRFKTEDVITKSDGTPDENETPEL